MERKKIILDIDKSYKRIDLVIQYGHYKTAKKILNKLYYKSEGIDYPTGVNAYFEKVIIILYYTKNYILIISLIQTLIKKYIKINELEGQVRMFNLLGITLAILSDFNASTHYLKKALEISINLKPLNIARISSVYLGLGFNELKQKNNFASLKYLNIGLSYFKNKIDITKYPIGHLHLVYNKTQALIELNKITEAKKTFSIIDSNSEFYGIKEKSILEILELNFLYYENKYNSLFFINKCNKVLDFAKNVEDEDLVIEVLNLKKEYYIINNNYEKALYTTDKTLELYNKNKQTTSILPIKTLNNLPNNDNFDFVYFEKNELLKASKYQKNISEKDFFSKKLEIKTFYNSAKTINGDYIGVFNLDKEGDFYLFVLADVVSDGLSGSYVSFMLDGIIKSIIYNAGEYDIKRIIEDINNILSKSLEHQGYVLLWAGILDLTNNSLESVNAGFVPTYILKGKEIIELNKGCTILGMFKALPEFESETIDFKNGDVLFTFSEGLKKTIDYSGSNFDKVIRDLINIYAEDKSLGIVNLLEKKISKHQNKLDFIDNVSCLAVEFKN